MDQTIEQSPKSNKQKLKVGAAAAMAGAMLVTGSLAYFTDRVDTNASATAGTVDIELASDWQDVENFNPGDKADLNFEISSVGNKSIDVRETFVVTSSEAMSDTGQAEFEIYRKADVTQDANGAYKPNPGAQPAATGEDRIVSDDLKTITYELEEYVLNGTGDAAETEDSAAGTSKASEYVLVFNHDASNDFQGATVSVDFLAEAKQHRNTGEDTWSQIANESVSMGGETVNAVPERN